MRVGPREWISALRTETPLPCEDSETPHRRQEMPHQMPSYRHLDLGRPASSPGESMSSLWYLSQQPGRRSPLLSTDSVCCTDSAGRRTGSAHHMPACSKGVYYISSAAAMTT